MLQTKRHARLQINTKMQHFTAKMLKTFLGGAQPHPQTAPPMGGEHPLPIPHHLRRLRRSAPPPPSYYFLIRPLRVGLSLPEYWQVVILPIGLVNCFTNYFRQWPSGRVAVIIS